MAEEQPLRLFFELLDAKDADASLGHAIHLLRAALRKKPASVEAMKAGRDFEESHSMRDGLRLLELIEDQAWPDENVVMPLRLILARLGHTDSEMVVSRALMQHQIWSSDGPQSERDLRLLQSIGWLARAAGGSSVDVIHYNPEPMSNALLQGYEVAQRIKRMGDLAGLLDCTADEYRDRRIEPGEDRYGGRKTPPEYLVGHVAGHLYSCGLESTAITVGVVARRIMSRFPAFAGHCDAIIADASDREAVWRLIHEMEAPDQRAFDCREEVESLLWCLAQMGDRLALCRSAAFVLRRAYDDADRELLQIACGMIAVAGGAREAEFAFFGANPVHAAIMKSGHYLIGRIEERAVASAKAPAEPDPEDKPDPAIEVAAAAEMLEPTVSEKDMDDLLDDPGMPESAKGVLAKKKQELRALNAKQRFLDSIERVTIIREIGNRDSKDSKQIVAELTAMQRPSSLAKMPIDLAGWRADLVAEFPHTTAAIDAIVGDLATRQAAGKKAFAIRPTLLVGNPGTGKSRLARRIAETADIPFRMIAAAGVADAMFAGTARGWHTGHPSMPFDTIRSTRCPNPVVLLDEIEKAGTSRHNGNLVDALLPMLEVETARQWSDPYVQAPIDLSHLNWLFTANTLAGLPSPFLDRLRIVHVDDPDVRHLSDLAASIVRDLAAKSGHSSWVQPLDGDELSAITMAWKRHRSLRHLQKLVGACLRARELAAVRH